MNYNFPTQLKLFENVIMFFKGVRFLDNLGNSY